jgi:hypothetical protein
MITRIQAGRLEKLMGQLEGIHVELSALAKKSPNGAVNAFKLRFVNEVLLKCAELLSEDYCPVGGFREFHLDDVPSYSDVTFVASQYLQALEKMRSDNIDLKVGRWWYVLPKGSASCRRPDRPSCGDKRTIQL